MAKEQIKELNIKKAEKKDKSIKKDKKEKKDKSDKEVAPKVAKNVESDNDSSDFESDAEVKPVKKVRETLEERLIRQGKAKAGEVKEENKPKVVSKPAVKDDDSSDFESEDEKVVTAKKEAAKVPFSAKQVFVSGLPYETTEEQLKEFFKEESEFIG